MQSYDDVYRQSAFYWGRDPNGLCERALAALRGAHASQPLAVDLGCGEGRDTICLARHGFEVTGVDASEPGLAKARQWANEEGLAIRTALADLNEYRLQETLDLVYASGTLTFLAAGRRAEIFRHYKERTRRGGVNAFNAFVEKPYLPVPPDWGEDEHFFRSGELLAFYWDWEIVEFEEVEFDCDSAGIPHRHAMDVLIARRPER